MTRSERTLHIISRTNNNMKNLLRMSLFIIARAGLCLAVVAWIVGPWCSIESFGGFTTASAFCLTGQSGIIVGLRSDYTGLYLDVSEEQSVAMWIFAYGEPEYRNRRGRLKLVEPVSGLILFSDTVNAGIAIHHWLIVSLFTAFNIALYFIYRKRPEGKPCEV
mgnify:CR=1 FL=1